ncbi:MAG: DnaA/Hda family protein [Magnetospirillum sp. WYHS-4]
MSNQLILAFEHRPALGGEDFLVADGNRDAVAWLDRWPDWPAPALVVHGPAGCGKSHLAQVFLAHCGGREATGADLAALEPQALIGPGKACVVEDAEALLARGLQRPLLHLYNSLRDCGGHLLLTARRPPVLWDMPLADLRSRLLAAPAVAIGAPDDALLAAVLVKLFADRQLKVEAGVVPFLAARIDRSFAAARRWVAALDEAALASRRNITIPFVRRILAAQGETSDPAESRMAVPPTNPD